MKYNHSKILLTSIILFYFFLISYLLFSSLQGNVIGRDATRYISLADSIYEPYSLKEIINEKTPPPLLITLIKYAKDYLDIPVLRGGVVISLICGSLCSVFVFTGCWVLSRKYYFALFSSILFFLTPGVRDISIDILRDAPSLCSNIMAINFFLVWSKNKCIFYIMLCGCAIAVSLGFRHENIEFVPIFISLILYLCIISYSKKSTILHKFGISFFSFVGGFALGYLLVYVFCLQSEFYSKTVLKNVMNYYLNLLNG